MAQCSTCGSTIPESAVVCPDCGMELKSTTAPAMETRTSERQQPVPRRQAQAQRQYYLARKPRHQPLGHGLRFGEAEHCVKRCFRSGMAASIIGRFDPETGPVDVDLGPLPEAVYISRHHAEIWCDGSGQWFVKDLGSGNATFVCSAGERQFRKAVGQHPIKNGDEIAFGNARFEFRIG